MYIEENLKKVIEARFETVKYFSEYIDLPYTTVRSILQRGILNSKLENVIKIADGLDTKPEELLDLGNGVLPGSILTVYNKLQPTRKEKVYNFAEHQLNEQNKIYNLGATAAGSALEYTDDFVEEEELQQIPDKADFVLTIKGDSMEPEIENGSKVFVQSTNIVENGETAIIEVDGDGVTCKKVKYDYDNQKIVLQSLNAKYEDMIFDNNRVRVVGRVL